MTVVRRVLVGLVARMLGRVFSPLKEMRRSQFEALGIGPGKIVFLGDSITEYGLWNEWLPDWPVVNRGIGAETTAEVLGRLDAAINAPRAVFLLIGTNDLTLRVPRARIVDNVRAILAGIEGRAAGTRVVVQSVMPRNATYRAEILALNEALRSMVAEAATHVSYLDLWPALQAPGGTLRRDFTKDDLHLSGPGFAAWVEVLRPLVAEAAAIR